MIIEGNPGTLIGGEAGSSGRHLHTRSSSKGTIRAQRFLISAIHWLISIGWTLPPSAPEGEGAVGVAQLSTPAALFQLFLLFTAARFNAS